MPSVLTHHTLIALLSRHPLIQGDREECLAAGMDDYLTKPIQLKVLQEALERAGLWIKRRTAPPQPLQQLSQRATLPAYDGRQEESPALERSWYEMKLQAIKTSSPKHGSVKERGL